MKPSNTLIASRHLRSPSSSARSVAHPFHVISLVALGTIAACMLFWRLGAASLTDWDEAIYAQIAKEIVASGDWLTLHWGYNPWFHKPPLFMWATAGFFKVFGVSEFWARVPSALSGLGLVGCTYLIARKLQGPDTGHLVGLMAAAVLLTNYTFVHFSRFGTTDVALTFFTYMAIYAYLWVHERPQQHQWAWCGVWLGLAAAMMTKGVAGLAGAIALALTLVLTGRLWVALRSRAFWVGAAIAALVIVPWHWAMWAIHGQAFVDQYLIYHVVERSTGGGLEGNTGGPFYYFRVLSNRFFPWVYLVPLALFQQCWKLRERGGSRGFVLLMLVGVVFGGFSLASTKLNWYIIPIYPALSIWVGMWLHQAFAQRPRWMLLGLLASSTIVMALFPSQVVFLSSEGQQLLTIAGLVALVLLSAAVYEFGWSRRVLAVSLCGLFLLAGLREIKGIYHGHERPVATLSQAAEAPVDPENPPLLVAKLSESLYTPAALFYSNRPIAWARSLTDLSRLTSTQLKQDILMATEDIQPLSATYDIDVYAKKGELTYAGIRRRQQ